MITLDWEIGQRVWIWYTDQGATELLLETIEVRRKNGSESGLTVAMRVRYERAVLGLWLNADRVYRTREACEEANRDLDLR